MSKLREQWDLYTNHRMKTGRTIYRGESIPDGYYHQVVSVWIKNSKDEYLLSQRHPSKNHPLRWECTGGSVICGETSLQGAIREVKEELGVRLDSKKGTLLYRVRRNHLKDFYDVWMFTADISIDDLRLEQSEVIDAQWLNKAEIISMYNNNQLHPLINNLDEIL